MSLRLLLRCRGVRLIPLFCAFGQPQEDCPSYQQLSCGKSDGDVPLEADGSVANAHHVKGALVLAVVWISAAEVASPFRYVHAILKIALMATPFIYSAALVVTVVSLPMGLWSIALSIKRGEIRETHGSWDRLIQ